MHSAAVRNYNLHNIYIQDSTRGTTKPDECVGNQELVEEHSSLYM